MDGQYSWKRTDEADIDLSELLRGIFGQWKRIVFCALAFAVFLGGYGYRKERNASAVSDIAQDEDILLTEAEEQAVADAVQLEHEIKGLETYLDNSVLMQIDPYHKNKYIMLYCISQADRQKLPEITESYLNFVLNGSAAEVLKKTNSSWKMDKSYIAELIWAYQKTYSYPYQVAIDALADSRLEMEALFYVEIIGKSARESKKMAMDLQKVIEDYSAKIKADAGRHSLKLLSHTENVLADSGLQTQQHDKKAMLSSNKNNLRAMTDAFSEGQMALYQKSCGTEKEDIQKDMEEDAAVEKYRTILKYMVLGLIGGIFAYSTVFTCWYIFNDTVKSTAELKRRYTFPVYGELLLEKKDTKNPVTVSRKQPDAFENSRFQVLNRIRLVCQKRGIVKFCAAADFVLSMQEKECLRNMEKQLGNWNIGMTVVENASMDAAVWDNLADNGTVLMICRTGMTTHQMIEDAMIFYCENEISVMGAAAFLQ